MQCSTVLQDYYYAINLTKPSLSFSADQAKGATGGFSGEFRQVCYDYNNSAKRVFHLFYFTETKRASDADISSVIISMPIVAVNEILEPKSPSTVRVRIDMMAVADYQESLDYLLEHLKKNGVVGLENAILVQRERVRVTELKGLSLNELVKNQISQVAGALGYMVETNKSNLFQRLGSTVHNTSIYSTSRPDLFLYHHEINQAYIVSDKETILAATTENDATPLPQLLANMEKVAGDAAWYWLRFSTQKVFKYIVILGLAIDYQKRNSLAYKLKMDFELGVSTLYIGDEELTLEDGINRLFASLEKFRPSSLASRHLRGALSVSV